MKSPKAITLSIILFLSVLLSHAQARQPAVQLAPSQNQDVAVVFVEQNNGNNIIKLIYYDTLSHFYSERTVLTVVGTIQKLDVVVDSNNDIHVVYMGPPHELNYICIPHTNPNVLIGPQPIALPRTPITNSQFQIMDLDLEIDDTTNDLLLAVKDLRTTMVGFPPSPEMADIFFGKKLNNQPSFNMISYFHRPAGFRVGGGVALAQDLTTGNIHISFQGLDLPTFSYTTEDYFNEIVLDQSGNWITTQNINRNRILNQAMLENTFFSKAYNLSPGVAIFQLNAYSSGIYANTYQNLSNPAAGWNTPQQVSPTGWACDLYTFPGSFLSLLPVVESTLPGFIPNDAVTFYVSFNSVNWFSFPITRGDPRHHYNAVDIPRGLLNPHSGNFVVATTYRDTLNASWNIEVHTTVMPNAPWATVKIKTTSGQIKFLRAEHLN